MRRALFIVLALIALSVSTIAKAGWLDGGEPPAGFLASRLISVYVYRNDYQDMEISISQLAAHLKEVPGMKKVFWEKVDARSWTLNTVRLDPVSKREWQGAMLLSEFPERRGVLVSRWVINGDEMPVSAIYQTLSDINQAMKGRN